ncbi:MAG: chromosome segregation protein SMC [Planctomycetota bacterium]
MRLQRLELFGFKSFADRTVIDFGSNSLTGIVGPNGCGKSNVVDAVRWVLGETRPTSMRGSGMVDVIFKGSASRPALGIAEVTIVLANENDELSGYGPEIAITRRLFKDGSSEYQIDSAKVRLKDVKDLLYDTGLGSRGYSVLEQGRIDAVLSANPLQRRAIFEEAAGISRYRQRRHEAELRLKRVDQDVARVDDVLGELRSRVRSLKIQAGKAERYVAAKDEWTRERRRYLAHRLTAFDAGIARLSPLIHEAEGALSELRQRRAACERDIEASERSRSEVVSALDRTSGRLGAVAGDLRAIAERQSQLAMRVASWRASAREEAQRGEALEAQLAERREEHAAFAEALESLRERATHAEERARGLAGQARELSASYKEVRAAVQRQNDVVLAKLHEKTGQQNRAGHLAEALPAAQDRVARTAERAAALDASYAAIGAETEAARARLAQADGNRADAEGRLAAAEADLVRVGDEIRATEAERTAREVERAAALSRVEALRDRDRELEDLSAGARKVVEAVQAGTGPCKPDDLLGIVADHLTIDTRLARALDAVLGERAHALVARDAHVARRIVDWCATQKLGQVAVVIPPGIGAPDCPPPSDYSLFAQYGAGVEGRLGELTRVAPDLRPLARALLCDVVIVSNLDLALELIGLEPGWRFATPRGEVVDAAGFVGGHREVAQGFIGRRASANDLEERAEALAEQVEAHNTRLAELADEQQRLVAERLARRAALDAAQRERAEADSGVRTCVARASDLGSARDAQAAERKGAEAEAHRLAEELEEARAAAAYAEEELAELNERLETMEEGRRRLEAEREDLSREENRAQVEHASAKSELGSLEQRLHGHARLLVETEAEITRAHERSAAYETSAGEGEAEVEGLVDEAEALAEQRAELEEELEELRERERGGAAKVQELRRAADDVQGELDERAEVLGKQRLELQRTDLARTELLGRAGEELALDAAALLTDFVLEAELEEDGALRALEKHVHELKSQLDKLGPVNVEAMQELEEVGARLEHLEVQAKDLSDARKGLLETIRTIDEESRRMFMETFEEVRTNFQRIFRQLFGGGKADIVLAEGEDVLEAGVDILARPPGRELLPIGLLSGGQRTMTALALLFAVFEARPSPFCVLDEVDAALDDANIDRFLGMLDGFRSTTQFIVVTHNKGTMSACQALYGVTMQIKGVSRFVAVELGEVDELAPGTTGKARELAPSSAGDSGDEEEDGEPRGPFALDRRPARDRESGEPVKEIVPARASVPEPEHALEGERASEPELATGPD